ncbi:MAG: hypothetical protein IJ068_01295 [Bacilli bacterium]|nr:hypothetical protein [Bacilli bacterium]
MCENVLFLRILSFFYTAMSFLRFTIPIILIIKLTFDIYKGIINTNDNSFKEKVSRRIIACVIIFLVPTIINVFLGLIETVTGMAFNYSECTANIKNIDYYVEKRELEEKLLYEKESSEAYQKYQNAINDLTKKIQESSSSTGSGDATAIRIGEKYNVTDKQLENIAKVCQREQGRPEGAAAEAELMINKYVLSGYSGSFYDYLFNSSNGNWWHPIKAGNYGSTKLKPEIKEAVRKVVVEGQRKYPAYINEHDCISCGDVLYIKTDGQSANKNNRSDFVQDKTFVYTKYKQNSKVKYWIFYAFPDEKSDPFGYTYDAKDKLAAISK